MSLDTLSVQDFLTALNWNPAQNREHVPGQNEFPYGNRVALISPPQEGKTAVVSGLFMRAQQKVRETVYTDTPFYCRVLEGGSNIHQDISNLMSGYFPSKTRSYLGFRSSPGLLLEQKKFLDLRVPLTGRLLGRENIGKRQQLWHKMLQLPICDLPGETLTQVMWQVRALQNKSQLLATKQIVENAIMEMRESDAYIFILKASTAMGLGQQLETEHDQTISSDPDVNITRMLEDLINYKMSQGKQIKRSFIAITAWDKMARRGQQLGFNFLDPYLGRRTMEDFVASCYPQFYAALHSSLRSEQIDYYPLYFQTEKNDNGTEKIFEDEVMLRDETGTLMPRIVKRPHIIVKDVMSPDARNVFENARKIEYSIAGYDRLLNDVMKLAEAAH
jgi:hypothetical protein